MNNDQKAIREMADSRAQAGNIPSLWCEAMWGDEVQNVPEHACWLMPEHPATQPHECLCGETRVGGVTWPAMGVVGVGSGAVMGEPGQDTGGFIPEFITDKIPGHEGDQP